jgi:hypothetical protein
LHRFKPHTLLFLISCENAELALVLLSELLVCGKEGEGSGGVGDMVVCMSGRINVERGREESVPLKPFAFIVALKELGCVAR